MPIAASDMKVYLSGGSSNTSAAASIGGAISSTLAPAQLYTDITAAQANSGVTLYRGIYIKNTHATLSTTAVRVYLLINTPSPDTDISIGLSAQGLSTTMTAVANETTAPSSVTFS